MNSNENKVKGLASPQSTVAEEILTLISTTTNSIKAYIVASINDGLDATVITKELNKRIAEAVKGITNDVLKAQTRQSLVTAAKSWYWQYTKSLDILNRNLGNKLGVNLVGLSYNKVMPQLRSYIELNKQTATPVIADYQMKVKAVVRALATEPVKVITRKDGKVYTASLRNRAESLVRYEANLEDIKTLKDSNVKLMWISSHPNCSKRCEPWQGRLYSLDGSSGVVDGIKYTPLAEAIAGTMGNGNGILNGYNCRHRGVEYTRGSRGPVEYSKQEIALERSIDQRQRSYENRIRNLKSEEQLYRASNFVKDAQRVRARWRLLTQRYQEFSQKNGRAFYRWRCV